MRSFITILLLLISNFVYSQYPELDEHTSIGGVGEWYNQSGHANMGVEGGTTLCYNIGVNYSNSQQYIFESSDYGTQFVDDGLDSVRFSVNLTLDIRSNGDLFYMGYYDGGTWTDFLIPYRQVGTPTTFFVWAPKTTTKFRYRLWTGGSGTTNGKFVHINWTELESNINVLPIELIDWNAVLYEDEVRLTWVTASEINNDYFEVMWSEDAINWRVIDIQDGFGNSSQKITYTTTHKTTSRNNYYKLSQTDFDGSNEEFKIIFIEVPIVKTIKKEYIYINLLGQVVDKNYNGIKIVKEL